MKKILSNIAFVLVLTNSSLHAQVLVPGEIIARGEMVRGYGYSPKSVESLVGTSTIIVKGKFNRFIKSELFYGFNNSREEMQRILKYTDAELDEVGLPVSDYEVKVEEVLLGAVDLRGKTIIYRLSEQPEVAGKYTSPNINRLFFLVRNPDGSYSALGPASIQNEKDGYYSFDSLAANPNEFTGDALPFIEDSSVDSFDSEIKREISRVYGQ